MTIDKLPIDRGELNDSDDGYKLCLNLTPRIVKYLGDFYSPGRPHPFLDGLANGGFITSHPELDTKDTEHLTILRAAGLRDTLSPKKFEEIGIPKEVAERGQMWVITEDKAEYEKNIKITPACRKEVWVGHCYAYWDRNSSKWHVKRLKDNASEF